MIKLIKQSRCHFQMNSEMMWRQTELCEIGDVVLMILFSL